MATRRNVAAKLALAVGLSTTLCLSAQQGTAHLNNRNGIHRVLLISIDGMHALDFLNCSRGVPGVNFGQPYCPTLARLAGPGINYTDTATSKPSDSFPGLTAIVSGGSPRVEGVFYDVAYDRSLNPPAITTGNGVAGGPCKPGATPSGTTTEYEEGIDIDQTQLNGVDNSKLSTFGGGVAAIDPRKLPRDRNCPFTRGTSSGRIRFSALSTRPADTRPGLTSTPLTPRSPVPGQAWRPISTIIIRRRSTPT